MKDFFISYNKADRSWAEWIAWHLDAEDYKTVIQAWDFRPGSKFGLEMHKAAIESKRTIAVLSPDYLNALYTQPEWEAAFVQDPTGVKGMLLPVRVRECAIEGMLTSIIYVDLVGLDEEEARGVLLAGVSRERAKPAAQPLFPGHPSREVAGRPRFPGALPTVWNVPHRRNPNFTGREDLLDDLRGALNSQQSAALTQAIYGLGGVGKTQLALEYTYRFASEYDYVWWVRAEDPAVLTSDYANLAREMSLPEKDATDQAIIVQSVRRWLGQNKNWLLVFDNVREPSDLHDYLPQSQIGHVIVTSRNPNWRGVASPLRVAVLKRSESVEFLLKRTDQKDEGAAGDLADVLGDLPLALEQAGAYIEATGRSISEYLDMFHQRQTELLNRGELSTDYPYSVVTTWGLSFRDVQVFSPGGADLLILCSFLAPDDIPLELITRNKKMLPEALATVAEDEMALDDAVSALRSYSLIEFMAKTISVHRLVQAVTRGWLEEDKRKEWAGVAVCLVNDAFPYEEDDLRTWPESARLLPHAMSACRFAEESELALEENSRLLNECGLYLKERAEFSDAKETLGKALASDEKSFEPGHPSIARSQSNLATVLKDLGELEEARDLLRKALASYEKSFEPGHPSIATSQSNLAMVLKDLGELEEARDLARLAYEAFLKKFGPHHPNTKTAKRNWDSI